MHAGRMSTCIEPTLGITEGNMAKKAKKAKKKTAKKKKKSPFDENPISQLGLAAAFAYRISAQQSGRTVMQMAAA